MVNKKKLNKILSIPLAKNFRIHYTMKQWMNLHIYFKVIRINPHHGADPKWNVEIKPVKQNPFTIRISWVICN